MTTELKEAIDYLKERVAKLKKWKEDGDLTEAIDTVVSYCEKSEKIEFLKSANQHNPITHPYDLSKK